MRLLINTSWSSEGENLWLGIDVQGLASFLISFAVLLCALVCKRAVDAICDHM